MFIQIRYGKGAPGAAGAVHALIEIAVVKAVELTVALVLAADTLAVGPAVAERLSALSAVIMSGGRYFGVYVSPVAAIMLTAGKKMLVLIFNRLFAEGADMLLILAETFYMVVVAEIAFAARTFAMLKGGGVSVTAIVSAG